MDSDSAGVARLADLLDAATEPVSPEDARLAARELRRLLRKKQELDALLADFGTASAWMAGNGDVISDKLRDEWVALGEPEWLLRAGARYRCRVFTVPLHPGPRLANLFRAKETQNQPPAAS